MLSLVYVSRLLVQPEDRAEALDDIQAVSIARNSMLDITGLLISTSHYFAQLLEGPPPGVDAVMGSILNDPRHHEVRIMRRSERSERRCPLWRMARFDRESFGSVWAEPLLAECHAGDNPDAVARLDRLIDKVAIAQSIA